MLGYMTGERSQCRGLVVNDAAGIPRHSVRAVFCLAKMGNYGAICSASRLFYLVAASFIFMTGLLVAHDTDPETHAGLLFDSHPLTLESGWRREAVGPFYYRQQTELEKLWAVPPLFSQSVTDGDSEEYDVLYPLLTYNRAGAEYRWQLFQLLSFSGGQSQDEVPRDRFTIFPLYFQQRSPDSNQNYTALFPIYGHLKNRIFRSEIDFALWPLYVKTIRRPSASPLPNDPFLSLGNSWLSSRRGDMTTYNYAYPFFHLRYGEGLFGWQLWPLLGHEQKKLTTKTNNWGDLETSFGHDKKFYLWPIYSQSQRGIGSTNQETDLLVFPLYRQFRSPARDSTSYFPPVGLTITEDRARKYREIGFPWPIIVFTRGEGKTVNRVWPFFGQAKNIALESDYYLWPLYKFNAIGSGPLNRERTRILLFLYSRTEETNKETKATKTRTDLWPLFTHRTDYNGNSRLQILAPLEPFVPASKSIERNWSPLWSLWRSENNPRTGEASQSVLWNLYRREVSPETKKGSLLFGLIQYESSAEKQSWRLFYLPLKNSSKVSDHVPEHR